MNLYRCVTHYRENKNGGPVEQKNIFILSDCIEAAYIKARIETKDFYCAGYPEVTKWVAPAPSFVCNLNGMLSEYGSVMLDEAKKQTGYTIMKTTTQGKNNWPYVY